MAKFALSKGDIIIIDGVSFTINTQTTIESPVAGRLWRDGEDQVIRFEPAPTEERMATVAPSWGQGFGTKG